ncbi:Acetylornithine aminotransferase [Candidatus Nitrosocaldus cavascurensis]|jgi:acetylornithine/LysW-gamma-L-lysine aminotransferase|uniref:Acetylornithine aminotransferase n=2 Tax=Candidatus Nitrosocaldaceae TaxID=1968910 RepID=A0A2K5ARY8_9ARCH|nr:Acetylornithine aminotransferase [Candidatus Nitrosocaldus cavascurensis]
MEGVSMSLEGSRMKEEDSYIANVFQRYPVELVRGKGAYVWDSNGKAYIDFMAGYGVALVGHCNDKVVDAVKRQAERLITCHCSCYNDTRLEFLRRLVSVAPKGLNKVFLCNSGAEACEAAIKIARKYTKRHGIVAAVNSFHGKTMGALSITYASKYREPFKPLLDGVNFVPYSNADRLEELLEQDSRERRSIGAVILEPIQGEGGINVPDDGYLARVRELCNKYDLLLILDEIQSGLGRTGMLWASEHWGVVPDVMCIAKGMAGGVPMGAVLARQEVMDALKVGEHSNTFGGNPLACAAAKATLDCIIEDDLVGNASRMGKYMKDGLLALKDKHKVVRDVRGLGLMLGVELRFDVRDVLMDGLSHGLMMLYSGRNVIRLLPPLVVDEDIASRALSILDRLLTREEERRGVV